MKHFFSFKLTFLVSLICLLAGASRVVAQTPVISYTLPRAGKTAAFTGADALENGLLQRPEIFATKLASLPNSNPPSSAPLKK